MTKILDFDELFQRVFVQDERRPGVDPDYDDIEDAYGDAEATATTTVDEPLGSR